MEGNDESLTSGHITQSNRQYRQYMNRRGIFILFILLFLSFSFLDRYFVFFLYSFFTGGFNKILDPDKDVARKSNKPDKNESQAAKRGKILISR